MAKNPKHQPTEKTRKKVKLLSGVGSKQRTIAAIMGISLASLKRHYKDELKFGLEQANDLIAGKALELASKGKEGMIKYWLDHKASWALFGVEDDIALVPVKIRRLPKEDNDK